MLRPSPLAASCKPQRPFLGLLPFTTCTSNWDLPCWISSLGSIIKPFEVFALNSSGNPQASGVMLPLVPSFQDYFLQLQHLEVDHRGERWLCPDQEESLSLAPALPGSARFRPAPLPSKMARNLAQWYRVWYHLVYILAFHPASSFRQSLSSLPS